MYWIPLVLTMTVFPSNYTPVQNVCMSESHYTTDAKKDGYDSTALRGADAMRWMGAYAQALGQNPEDVLRVDSLLFFTTPKDTSFVLALAFKNGCYVGNAVFPAEDFQRINKLYLEGAKRGT